MIHTEWEAKQKLSGSGVRVPASIMLSEDEPWPADFPTPSYVKAQVLHGGRGKAGLVVRVDDSLEGPQKLAHIREKSAGSLVMVEQAVAGTERYISVGIDPVRAAPVLTLGLNGGVDIEDSPPESIVSFPISMRRGLLPHDVIAAARALGFPGKELAGLAANGVRLWRSFLQAQAQLVEVNPLIWDGSTHTAVDAKLISFEQEDDDGLVFFDRPGRIAVLSVGAGLGMALGDALDVAGPGAANFSDIVGGLSQSAMEGLVSAVVERAKAPTVDSIIIAFSLSNTPIEGVLEPLCAALPAQLPVPTVAYLSGTIDGDPAKARALSAELTSRGVQIFASVSECVAHAAKERKSS